MFQFFTNTISKHAKTQQKKYNIYAEVVSDVIYLN